MPHTVEVRPETRKKLAAIVSIDVAGYSALAERDQEDAARHVARLRIKAGAAARAHAGRIFNTAGDGAMLEFDSASDALSAAIALCDAPQDVPLRFGVHLGEVVIAADGDLLGHGVNVAARLQAAADPGAILISQIVRDLAPAPLAQRFSARGKIKLAKMRETLSVFAFASAHAGVTAPARTPVLAVLPFDNLSRDQETGFFSDGVSAEILYSVSRVRGLKVIGANSSFAFRGRDKAKAAEALSATHILDGAVRRAGARVRISAQLTDAETGFVLWSERYDRELDATFELQEEIAAEAAGALTLALDAARRAHSAKVTASVFDSYLRAREHVRSGAPARLRQAAGLLAGIVEDAPDFARGWSALALARGELMRMAQTDRPRLARDARDAAERAIGLDPQIGEAYAVLAALEEIGHWREREALCVRALEAEPNNAFLRLRHGGLLISLGRVAEGYAEQAAAFELDPLDPMVAAFHGHNVWATHSKEEGKRILDEAAQRAPDNIFLWYIRLNTAALDGEFARVNAMRAEGARLLPEIQDSPVLRAGVMLQSVLEAPSAEAFAKLGEDYMAMAEAQPSAALDLAVAMSAIGLVKPALSIFEEALDNTEAWRLETNNQLRPHIGYETAMLFIQATVMLRMDPAFVRLAARLGLVRYWRETGAWPDCAAEVGYDFRAEAEKIG